MGPRKVHSKVSLALTFGFIEMLGTKVSAWGPFGLLTYTLLWSRHATCGQTRGWRGNIFYLSAYKIIFCISKQLYWGTEPSPQTMGKVLIEWRIIIQPFSATKHGVLWSGLPWRGVRVLFGLTYPQGVRKYPKVNTPFPAGRPWLVVLMRLLLPVANDQI